MSKISKHDRSVNMGELQDLEQYVLDNPATHYYKPNSDGYNTFDSLIPYHHIVEIWEEDDFPSYLIFMDSDDDPIAWYDLHRDCGFKV